MTKKSTNNRRNVGADACTTAQEHATAAIARDPGSCITEFEVSARPRAAGGMRERCTRPINPLLAMSAMPRAAELAGDCVVAEFALPALPNPTRSMVAVAKIALELSDEGPRG